MLLVINMQIQVCLHMTRQKYFMHHVILQFHIFFASFIASTTSYVIFLTSFCQAGIESSTITCQIVCVNTIILYVCDLFKIRMRFTIMKKKMPHMSDKAVFMQYKYPISANI